jgi:uncharacterized phiE125 gp8 family phage protein
MRWLDPEVTIAPTADVVTRTAAKAHLRVDDTDSDALIDGYLAAAVSYVEQFTGLRLASQTVKLRAWGLEDCTFRLPAAPIQSITSIKYLDANGAEQTLDPTTYVSDLHGIHPTISRAFDKVWPAHIVQLGSVTITAVCGYADGTVPTAITQAIQLMVGDWFANRETSIEGRFVAIEMVAVDALLANFRRSYV